MRRRCDTVERIGESSLFTFRESLANATGRENYACEPRGKIRELTDMNAGGRYSHCDKRTNELTIPQKGVLSNLLPALSLTDMAANCQMIP